MFHFISLKLFLNLVWFLNLLLLPLQKNRAHLLAIRAHYHYYHYNIEYNIFVAVLRFVQVFAETKALIPT